MQICWQCRPGARSFVSGHSDGSVILYSIDRKTQTKILTHPCAPYALVYTANGIVAAGCDQRVVSYNETGRVLQQFDYTSGHHEKEFTVAMRDPSGQNVVLGSFDRFVPFTFDSAQFLITSEDRLYF